jgi:hypothetical protein
MKTIIALVMASGFLAAPALADTRAHFQILDTDFQGACGSVNPILNTLNGNPAIDFVFPDMSVNAEDGAGRERKLCNVRLHLKPDPGYALRLGEVFYQGKVDIDPAGGSGNVSGRAFFLGLRGLDGYQRFSAGESRNFTVDVRDGSPDTTACSAETYLNLLVDLTAREKPGNGEFSEIAVQRGVATPNGVKYTPVISCGIWPVPCGG